MAWAVSALGDGFDSPSLRRLAAEDATVGLGDAQPLFEPSIRELNIQLPESPEALRRAYLKVVSEQIVNGSRAIEDALDVIHRVSPLDGLLRRIHPWRNATS